MNDIKNYEEYFRIYAPWEEMNNCCILCKKCFGGCSWADNLEPVKGWKAKQVSKKTGEFASYKIYFCPEFEEGDAAEGCEYDENGCMDLLEAVYRNAAEDFKKAYKQKLKLERRGKSLYRDEIKFAEDMMRDCTFLLGGWAAKLMKAVEAELKVEEGDADG